jgi:glucose/arabinose dehydrogenase
LGDHFAPKELAQKLDNHIGKIVRITTEGVAPADNPFVGKQNALAEIWAYGLRNAEGLAFNPADGKLWEQEHGPMGGDEINIIEKGRNYGWPRVSYGVNYDGTPVGNGKGAMDGVTDPIWHWTPSIAPSGMAFYTGDLIPHWKGSLFNGALKFELLSRLELKGEKAVKEERLLKDLHERIRDVRQGPDGRFTFSQIIRRGASCASCRQNKSPPMKYKECAGCDQRKAKALTQCDWFAQIDVRERGKHHERDDLLYRF